MNGPTLLSIAALLLILYLVTAKKSSKRRPLFGKVIDTDQQEYTFYEF
jgi:hypothetical protein